LLGFHRVKFELRKHFIRVYPVKFEARKYFTGEGAYLWMKDEKSMGQGARGGEQGAEDRIVELLSESFFTGYLKRAYCANDFSLYYS